MQYNTINPDSIKPPQTIHFDIDKQPSKPFGFNDFKTLPAPIEQKNFDLDALPDSAFGLDEAVAQPFHLQQFKLPKPTKVKAGVPKLLSNTTTGVLQLGIEEGLPGTNISAFVTDSYGYTWLATEKGLCMYDGEYIYIHSFINKNAVGSYYDISSMAIDKQGNIWIASAGDGIYILNTTTNIVKHNEAARQYSQIICDHIGMIWAGSYTEGLFVIDPVKETIKNINRTKNRSRENSVSAIAEDRDKNIWLSYFSPFGYTAIVDTARKSIKKIIKNEGLFDNGVIKFLEDSRGDMWM
ncbi:MAG: hypothetical protein JST09_07230, partial [Bacteroidetes bacterium]|nr:hypothetical protein [Bacteroidota bacterium]